MRVKNPYIVLSIGLLFIGLWLAPVAYLLLESTPLSALGISLVILGAVCFVLGKARPAISPEVSAILLETGMENISTILEELGLRAKAIYLPSSRTQGQFRALIPIHSTPSLPQIKKTLPRRLIVQYGPDPEDIGLLITTPGSATVRMLEAIPGSTPAELEEALSSILDGMLDIADTTRVGMTDGGITIEVSNPRMEYKNMPFYKYLGSPLASIAATLAAETLDKLIVVEREEYGKGKSVIELVILG